MINRHLVCIGGKSATGKTASLRNLRDPRGVIYGCCESGKELPFAGQFREAIITDPLEIPTIFAVAEEKPNIHTVVIDTLTYLMDMYESKFVIGANNTMQAWSDYAQYFKKLMQETVAASRLNVVFLAHTMDILNDSEHVMETMIKVKGSLMNHGIESYFNNVISAKKMSISKLADYQNDLLTITEEEEAIGIKHVFQTRTTKATVNERIRGPMGLWKINETFIDNDLQLVLDRLHDYYNGAKT